MSKIAEFEIQRIQFLGINGEVLQPLPDFAKNPEDLIKMYRSMNLIRTLDTKAVNLQRMGKMGTYPSSLGQEAVSVGMGYAMNKEDVFIPYYRDQGAMILRGVKPAEILGYWGGDERCNNYQAPQVREDFPIAIPVGSQNLHAAGVAYALKYHKQKRAAICTCGDGGTSKGDFYEALNFVGVQHLPAVFVINNNQWAISVPLHLQTAAKTIAQKAIAAGIEGIQVDGNDVIAVRYAVKQAIDKAHQQQGPTLIEALTYRLCDHTTADDARRYCDPNEIKQAWDSEPILRLRKYLMQQNLWTEADEKKMLEECTTEINKAAEEYLKSKPAELTDIIDYLYVELPEELIEQRTQIASLSKRATVKE